jgi:hypothetical protein
VREATFGLASSHHDASAAGAVLFENDRQLVGLLSSARYIVVAI